jgi:hypothetical protein
MPTLANCPKNNCDLSDSDFNFGPGKGWWDEESATCHVTCKVCGAEWDEVYRFDYTDTEELENDDE